MLRALGSLTWDLHAHRWTQQPYISSALYKLSPEGLFLPCLSCAEGVLVSSWVTAVPHLVMEPPGWDLNPPPWVDFLAWSRLSLVSVGLPAGCGTWSEGLTSPVLWCCLMIWTLLGPSLCLSVCLAQMLRGGLWDPLGFHLAFPEAEALFLLLCGRKNPFQLLLRFALPVRVSFPLFPKSVEQRGEEKHSVKWEGGCQGKAESKYYCLLKCQSVGWGLKTPCLYQHCLSACQVLPVCVLCGRPGRNCNGHKHAVWRSSSGEVQHPFSFI